LLLLLIRNLLLIGRWQSFFWIFFVERRRKKCVRFSLISNERRRRIYGRNILCLLAINVVVGITKKKLNPRFILLLLMSLKTHIYYFRCELFCVQLQTPPYWRNWSTHFNIFVQLERQQGWYTYYCYTHLGRKRKVKCSSQFQRMDYHYF
jgi:hypothetical protein